MREVASCAAHIRVEDLTTCEDITADQVPAVIGSVTGQVKNLGSDVTNGKLLVVIEEVAKGILRFVLWNVVLWSKCFLHQTDSLASTNGGPWVALKPIYFFGCRKKL
jgi:hypothetical protein